jgi:centromeric protein E
MHTLCSVAAGFNGTLFAYGQTGSGKTHTMFGSAGGAGNTDEKTNGTNNTTGTTTTGGGGGSAYGKEPGLIPRAIEALFAHMAAQPDTEFLLRCSYMEM